MDLYCPQCEAPRTPEQLDPFGNCLVCGAQILDQSSDPAPEPRPEPDPDPGPSPSVAESPGRTEPTAPRDTPVPKTTQALPPLPEEAPATESTVAESTVAESTEAETPITESSVTETLEPEAAAPRPEPEPQPEPEPESEPEPEPEPERSLEPERPREPPTEPEPEAAPAAESTPYAALVGDVEQHLENGYELFGLVGHPGSGKTHCLKALTHLLQRHGVGSQKAGIEFRKASVPGQTAARVFDYAYTGPGDEKWVFADAGGELYLRLRENDWASYPEDSTRLTRWLHRCHGLFCFLHLQPGHFRGRDLEVDPTHAPDEAARKALEARRRKAREDQEELELFRHFFLFLRALKAEDGRVERVIERCRRSDNLDEALRDYHARAPRLDIPVMFFFTQADAYARDDFEIAPGVHVHPRRLQVPPEVFAARYLPSLFSGLVSQVRHFKIDFLQSYVDHPTGRRNEHGQEIVETFWTDPQDESTLLSAGLMAGLELVLRHRKAERSRWHLPQLSTRQALRLHKLLHPGDWKGVPPNLLRTSRRRQAKAESPTPAGGAP